MQRFLCRCAKEVESCSEDIQLNGIPSLSLAEIVTFSEGFSLGPVKQGLLQPWVSPPCTAMAQLTSKSATAKSALHLPRTISTVSRKGSRHKCSRSIGVCSTSSTTRHWIDQRRRKSDKSNNFSYYWHLGRLTNFILPIQQACPKF
jgi:hypothetical protein